MVEAAARAKLRMVELTVSNRSYELESARAFFDDYAEAVEDSTFFTLPCRQRARALADLAANLQGAKVSCEALDKAVKSIDPAGKTNNLCKAFCLYDFARELRSAGGAQVLRQAEDMLADRILTEVRARFSDNGNGGNADLDPQVLIECLSYVPEAALRVNEALAGWSAFRLEEQRPHIAQMTRHISERFVQLNMAVVLFVKNALASPFRLCRASMSSRQRSWAWQPGSFEVAP